MSTRHIHFVTGRLAEHSLRTILPPLQLKVGFDYSISVLPITVAALMTPAWIARHLAPPLGAVPPEATEILIPGYCDGDTGPIATATKLPVLVGPRDLRRLPEYFGRTATTSYGEYDIEILAEINHAPRMSLDEILRAANELRTAGADLIDVGCDPGESWSGVGEAVRALREAGHRVSIDSLNPLEIAPAVKAGAELVLSVNSSNREAALDWGCEVVVLPDVPANLAELDETVEMLATAGVRLRIDPVLEPIGFGFTNSLVRYHEVRRRYPEAEMMMGIGNLTELTDADSEPINVLLLAICQELGIRSILTTQVINWARTSVQECDLARRLVYHAINDRVLPKHVEPRLVMLRGPRPLEFGAEELARLASEIKDNNYRILAERGEIHLLGSRMHLHDADPFNVLEQLLASSPKNIDASHAFYLGFEMAKALTALTLGKDYRQDEALDWGFLTRPEVSHRVTRIKKPETPSE